MRGVTKLVRSGHAPTLIMGWLYFLVSFGVWLLVGMLAVYLAPEFRLTDTETGLLVSLPVLVGSLIRVPMGILVDRIGPKRVGLIGQGVTLVPLLWGWLGARTIEEVACVAALLGVAGGSFAVALPLVSRWYPPAKQGLALGLVGTGTCGTALAALVAPRLAESFGWHGTFGWALIPVGVTLALYALLSRDHPSRPPARPVVDYLSILTKPDSLRLCAFYGFTFGGFVGLSSFLVIFFHDQYGVSKVTAGTLAAICAVAGGFSRPVGGSLADRHGGVRVLTLLIGVTAVGAAAMALPLPAWGMTALVFLVMFGLGMGNGAVFQLVPQRFRDQMGAATGVVGAAGGLGGFALVILLCWLKGVTGYYGTGFALLGLAGVVCGAWSHRLRRAWAPATEAA